MSDDKSKTCKPDFKRMTTGEDYGARAAAKSFGVTEKQIIDAVKAVGPIRADVEKYLKQ